MQIDREREWARIITRAEKVTGIVNETNYGQLERTRKKSEPSELGTRARTITNANENGK
jgi:hypothetical protein